MAEHTVPVRTILYMTGLYFGILLVAAVTCPVLVAMTPQTAAFWGLALLIKALFYKLTLSNPGFLEASEGNDSEVQPVPKQEDCSAAPKKPTLHLTQREKGYQGLQEEHSERVNPSTDPVEEERSEEVEHSRVSDLNITQIRFCLACQIEQPSRSKHCKECERCVALHDHHCPWLGVCVGQNNRRWFYLYLALQMTLLWWGDVLAVEAFDWHEGGVWAVCVNSLRGGLLVVLGFFTLMVTLLFAFHTYLASRNVTTWELLSWYKISYLKDFDRREGSPYSRGFCGNLKQYFCEALPKHYKDWQPPEPFV